MSDSFSESTQKKFAFLVHPRHEEDIFSQFPWLKYIPETVREWLLKKLPPILISEVTGLESKNGEKIKGYIYGIPVYPKQLIEDRKFASRKIKEAVIKARDNGVGLIGLGGQTASLSKGGLEVADIEEIGVTTGRAYTVKNITGYVKYVTERLSLEKSNLKVAVVGAAGSIGSSCVKQLDKWGIDDFILVDLERKLDHLRKVLKSHHDEAVVTHNISAIQDADIIITATNAPEVLVRPEDLKPGAVIINDAQPSDVSPRVLDERSDVLVIEGGVVSTPDIYCNVDMGLEEPDNTYCCLAEVLILAYHDRFENFAIGRLDHDLINSIEEMADGLNFSITKPQNSRGYISEKDIENTARVIKKHKQ